MVREIESSALAPAALAELKAWLGITLSEQDALLMAHLRSGLALCESFTGETLLQRGFEAVLPVRSDWQILPRRPVVAITGVLGLPAEGAGFALAVDAYAIDLDGDGHGRVRVLRPGSAGRVRVSFTAGLAAHWSDLAEPLRHGIVRLAAHMHGRDGGAPGSDIPAAVAALWRPYRRMRLA